ncbi:MAG: hypothetical protein Q9227_007968 [Pyrenula ochraceoflavens]
MPDPQSPRISYGRGGAGNVSVNDPHAPKGRADDFDTPTLKSKHYTTGRGGTGNMAKNDYENPDIARKRQDVDVPPMKLGDEASFHTGRGGGGNVGRSGGGEEGQKEKGKEILMGKKGT